MVTFVSRDGQRLTPYMLQQINKLDADFFAEFGVHIVVSSGIRTAQEQIDIFLQRYVTAGNINGRRVYDTRTWKGQTWYRISSAGTVATPGTSNHEIQGNTAAVDLRDTGSNAGLMSANSTRGRWIRARIRNYDMYNSGDSFGEGWHFDVYNIGATAGSGAGTGGSGFPARDKYGQAWVEEIQRKANRLGAGLAVDGQDGNLTQTWIKRLQKYNGLEQDGVAGPDTNGILDKILNLTVDGELGKFTIQRLQYAFGAEPDGKWGEATSKLIQTHLKVNPDGDFGTISWKAFQRALGFTGDAVDGNPGVNTYKALQNWLNSGTALTPVPEVPGTPTPEPEPPAPAATPRTPVYPGASRGLTVPLASARDAGTVVEWVVVHHQGSTNDDEEYFKTKNSRGSCPTVQVKATGEVVEFIPPDQRPSSSGGANNKSVAVETQNTSMAPNWGISRESHEAIAQWIAWLSQQTEINGVKFKILLDRDHIFGDKEVTAKTGIPLRATACPGPSMDIDWIVERAKEIVKPIPEPEPEPEPEPPVLEISRDEVIRRRSQALGLVAFFDQLLAILPEA